MGRVATSSTKDGTSSSYMTLIFYLSSLPRVGDYELPYGADKVIHFFEYAVLSFLITWSLRISNIKKYALIGWIIASLYSISDEIHQSFVPMRDASWGDVAADIIGAFAGAYWQNFLVGGHAGNKWSLSLFNI